MSVRAHRINKIDYSQSESFNLWHDELLVKELSEGGYMDGLNMDACGVMDISITQIEELLMELGDKVDKDTQKSLRDDIEWAKKRKEDYIQYYCF